MSAAGENGPETCEMLGYPSLILIIVADLLVTECASLASHIHSPRSLRRRASYDLRIVTVANPSSRVLSFLIVLLLRCSSNHSLLPSSSKPWLLKSRGHSGWRSKSWRWWSTRRGKALLLRRIETWRQKALGAAISSLRGWRPRRQP